MTNYACFFLFLTHCPCMRLHNLFIIVYIWFGTSYKIDMFCHTAVRQDRKKVICIIYICTRQERGIIYIYHIYKTTIQQFVTTAWICNIERITIRYVLIQTMLSQTFIYNMIYSHSKRIYILRPRRNWHNFVSGFCTTIEDKLSCYLCLPFWIVRLIYFTE